MSALFDEFTEDKMRPVSVEDISFVVTTYNRHRFLKSIISHLLSYDLPFRVHIFDNGSSHETIEVCRHFVGNYKNVFYHRSGKNEGFDRAMAKVGSCSKDLGKYSIWLADDDYFNVDGLPDIINIINIALPDFIQYSVANFYRKELKVVFYKKEECKKGRTATVFEDAPSYLMSSWPVIPAFCGIIVRNDILTQEMFLKYDGTYHAYAGALAEIAASGGASGVKPRILYVDDPNTPFGFFLGESGKTWTGQNGQVLAGIRRLMALLPDVYKDQVIKLWPSYKRDYFNHSSSIELLHREIEKERFYFDI